MAKKFYRWNAARHGMDAILVFDRSIFYGYDSKSFLNTKLNLQRPVVNHFVLRQFFSYGHFMKKGNLDRSVGVFAFPNGSPRRSGPAGKRPVRTNGLRARFQSVRLYYAGIAPLHPARCRAAGSSRRGEPDHFRILAVLADQPPEAIWPIRPGLADPRRFRLRAWRMDKQWGRKQMPPSPHSRRCPRERQHARVPHGFHFSYVRIAF
ncbi:hypothetical protein Cdeb_02637 [Caldibacillus debilis GB1]|uniref:Uncharacterized protein n=1 Tax=Caldibacillus debilis GB1 TaxID=1339248 RepID=A0A420VJ39_9BACI|nr:hypothetical protein Cdeb_02637 [Caldibacillus debilis GB1]